MRMINYCLLKWLIFMAQVQGIVMDQSGRSASQRDS